MTNSTTTILTFVADVLNPVLKAPVHKYLYRRDAKFEIDLDWLFDKEAYNKIIALYARQAKVDTERDSFDEWNFSCKLCLTLSSDDDPDCWKYQAKIRCKHIAYSDYMLAWACSDSPDGCKLLADLLTEVYKQLEKVQTT